MGEAEVQLQPFLISAGDGGKVAKFMTQLLNLWVTKLQNFYIFLQIYCICHPIRCSSILMDQTQLWNK